LHGRGVVFVAAAPGISYRRQFTYDRLKRTGKSHFGWLIGMSAPGRPFLEKK